MKKLKKYPEFNQKQNLNESIQNANTKLSTLQSYCEDIITNILENGEQSQLKIFASQVLNITKEIKIELQNKI